MPTQESLKLADLPGVLRRRLRPMLYAFGAVLLVSILAAVLWPPSYQSTGTILIEQQELPADLVRSAISSFADQRIQVITQRVMTTENLFKIIQRYGLYPKLRETAPREKIIKRMRDDVRFEMISADVIDPRAGRPTKATIAFSVSYRNRSPELAAQVANELVSLYLRVNIESRKQDAANAAEFMSDQAQRLSKHIDELQAQIAEFKQKHLDSLPDQAVLNSQQMYRAEDDVREAESQIRSLSQQISYLDAQLAETNPTSQVYTSTGERVLSPADRLKFLRTEYARVSAVYSPKHPDVLRLKREIEGLEKSAGEVNTSNDLSRQLEEAQAQLALAKQRYAENHPDVQRLERQVASLQDELRKEGPAPAPPAGGAAGADNIAYISLKSQREAAISQRASVQQKLGEFQNRVAEFEKRLAQAPDVERDYSALLRELQSTQISFNEVHQKEVQAEESQNLEDEHKGEKFTLIEPPLPPEQPASPNRTAILLVGLLLALAAALGTAAACENLDTSIRNRRDVESLLSVPPLAVLPWVESASTRRNRVQMQLIAVGGSVATLILALTLTHFLYRPLDVLWHVAMRRLGG
ncbi:MAG: hypothetical protein P4L83_12290 [Nevskia sp.]|nr:hypothetical protein [Nevskia sp.]